MISFKPSGYSREGRNPRTGAEIKIPARKVVVFRPAKDLRETVK